MHDVAGARVPLDPAALSARIATACAGLEGADPEAVLARTFASLYDGVTAAELDEAPASPPREKATRMRPETQAGRDLLDLIGLRRLRGA